MVKRRYMGRAATGSRKVPQRAHFLRRTVPLAIIVLTILAVVVFVVEAANTTNNFIGGSTGSLLVTGNWGLGHLPTVSEDAVFDSGSGGTGIRKLSAGSLTVGSFNVTPSSGTFSIRNDTSTSTNSALTLGGSGDAGNAVSGTAADLLYAASGSTFNIIGPNGSTGSGVLNVILGQSGNLDAAGTMTVSSVISDGGGGFGITKTGAGTLTLSGANTFTGGVTINAGTLTAGSTTALGPAVNATLTFGASSTGKFQLNGNNTTVIDLNTNATVGTPIIESGSATAGTDTFTVNTSNTDTYAGVLRNGSTRLLALTKSGAGTLILSGANTYTGGTTITAGTLTLGASGVLADAGAITLSGGTFKTGASAGFTETVGALALTDNSTTALGTGSHTLTFSDSHLVSWTSGKRLTITGWTGLYNGTSGTAGKIFVGSTSSGLTAGQLAEIKFYDGVSTLYPATILSTGEVVPLSGPTAVRLTGFTATAFNEGVMLEWQSGFEVNNLGYQLYREQNGQRTRVTPSVVAGSALTVGPGSRLTAGYSYSWFDPQGTPSLAYSLEAIDLDGSSESAGPIYPYAGPNGGGAPRHKRAMLLNEIVGESGDSSSVSSWPAAMKSSTSASLRESALNSGEWARGTDQSGARPPHSKEGPGSMEALHSKEEQQALTIQQSIAAGKAVKIQVRKSGWYRVTQSELVAAGFDPSSDARMLQLYVDGEEVPISLSSEGARLGANDTMEFYGVPLDTPTTDTQVYWLISGSSSGKRMIARRGKLKPTEPYTETVSGSFDLTTERREKVIYFSSLLNGDAENIFGSPIMGQPVNQSLAIRNVDRESVSQPQLAVALQGLTTGDHKVQLQVNGTNVGTMTFADREHPVAKFSVSPALLREGDNVVSLASTNGQSDISLIDWVRLTYPCKYKAANNTLVFSGLGGLPLKIEGFSSPNVRVVDVTNPNSPVQLSASVSTSGGSYGAKVQPAGNGVRTLIAFTEDLMGHPASITANLPSNWNAGTNGADMLILTHKDFRSAIEPLRNLRQSQGLSVAVVDVEDVYDEFSYGAHTPAAIKNFLVSAAANWTRKPAYLLLVGDSSWDPRNYLNQGENDFVPTKLIDTLALETGSDDWLADFNGVGLANMAVGRLPARTAAEANLMVSKILSYEQERELNAPLRGAVMVADKGFESQSSQTRALLPSNVTVQTINRAEVGNDDMTRGQIMDALNHGPMMVNYYGHGSVRVWTGEGLLSADLASSLTNTNSLSVFVMMTCLNGYASDAGSIEGLGEAVLKAPNGGAVAVWASSGFTTVQPQFEMNSEFYRLLFGGQPMRLGDATRNAKAATSDIDVRRTWILLGDPAMRVR